MTQTIAPEKHSNILQKLLELSVYCFIVFYPFSTWWCNASILAICVLSIFSSTLKEKIESFINSPGLWIMVIYSLSTCVGWTYSDDKKTAFALIERSVDFFILPLLFGTAQFRISPYRIFSVFIIVTVGAALFCIGSNIHFFLTQNIPFRYFFYWEYTYDHLTSFIHLHPTYFSVLILISILALVFYSNWSLSSRIFVFLFLSLFQIMLGSKIGIILLFLIVNIIAIVLLTKHRRKRLLVLYLVTNVSILTVLYNTPVVYWRFRRALESALSMTQEQQGTDYRLLHWMCAQGIIIDNPILGVGTGDSFYELNQCYKSLKKEELIDYNAHNQYLESWLKSGVVGMILVALVLTIPYTKSMVERNYFFGCVFLVFLTVSLVESIFQVQKGIAIFCFLSTLFQGNSLARRPQENV